MQSPYGILPKAPNLLLTLQTPVDHLTHGAEQLAQQPGSCARPSSLLGPTLAQAASQVTQQMSESNTFRKRICCL